ncbi:MAG: DUF512 domain-containing protein [Peptococcaceae bacterium]|nr:DUF512 domain-containing protein [Peptococcaceae bacterium]
MKQTVQASPNPPTQPTQLKQPGLLISHVDPQGIAAELGIEPGDRVISVDGQRITDILDFQYGTSEEAYTLTIAKGDQDELWELDIECHPEEHLGITFADVALDGLKVCHNNCVFCFVQQMPPGLRASLYEFDDDYRMSVSRGNYITLTNVGEEEFARILTLGVSPLHISVHAWDPEIRVRMMGTPAAANLPKQLVRLAQKGIDMHTQIVLVPGYNDGDVLNHTVHRLASLYPRVSTIGVVPVGLTRFRDHLNPLRGLTPQECAGILDEGNRWQEDLRERFGKNLVYFADEFYLACGRDIPPPGEYDGFEQIENGVGMLSSFREELQVLLEEGGWSHAHRVLQTAAKLQVRHLITGMLGAPFLQKCLAWTRENSPSYAGLAEEIHIHPIRNTFFGPEITVAGLVTATDIAEQVGDLGGEEFVIPRVMLKADEDIFLDGHSVKWLEEKLGGRARIVDSSARGFLEAIGS